MSKSGLVLDICHAEQPGRLLEEVALLVGVLRAAHESHGVGAIDGHLCVAVLLRDEPWGALDPITRSEIHDEFGRIHLLGGNPRLVARLPNLLRDPRDRVLPGDVLPVVAARRPVLGRREPVRRGVRREHGDAFDAQRSAIDDVVVVALHRQQLAVADGGDHAAPAGTEIARGGELADLRELQVLGRGPHRGNVKERADRESSATADGQPKQVSAGDGRRRSIQRLIHGFLALAVWSPQSVAPTREKITGYSRIFSHRSPIRNGREATARRGEPRHFGGHPD